MAGTKEAYRLLAAIEEYMSVNERDAAAKDMLASLGKIRADVEGALGPQEMEPSPGRKAAVAAMETAPSRSPDFKAAAEAARERLAGGGEVAPNP
jgi:hypothetical protein